MIYTVFKVELNEKFNCSEIGIRIKDCDTGAKIDL